MKKSMAGKKVAGTLLLAGLMMSAGAMAASGDPVQGGSGSVAINVPIVASTCSVSMPAAVNVGNIDSARISPAAVTAILAQESFDIGFTSCNGVPIQIITQSQSDNGAPLTDLKKGDLIQEIQVKQFTIKLKCHQFQEFQGAWMVSLV
ncbi:type 1 fimbrial protein [Salmonella enterica]|nr:type 1 fimbrial protein [Salmonella enterica]